MQKKPTSLWWSMRELARRYGWSRDELRALPVSEVDAWLIQDA